MRWALIASLVVHTALLLAGVIVLPNPQEHAVTPEEAFPVEIVDIKEFSKRVALSKTEVKEVENPSAKQVKKQNTSIPEPKEQAALPLQDEPEPEVPALPSPPVPDELEKKAKPEPKAAKVPVPRKKPKIKLSKKKKKKPPPKFSTAAMDELLNKLDEKAGRKKPLSETGTPRMSQVDTAGDSDQLSANEIDWLKQRVSSCWNKPVAVKNAENLKVLVEFGLNRDGTVRGSPSVVNSGSGIVFQAASESAVRAVLRCQPYDRLDPDKYNAWETVIVDF